MDLMDLEGWTLETLKCTFYSGSYRQNNLSQPERDVKNFHYNAGHVAPYLAVSMLVPIKTLVYFHMNKISSFLQAAHY